MEKLYLIDGMSLVFRAYHAMSRSGLQSPTGEPTYAVFAFINILIGLIEKEKPEYISVVFDTQAPTFRHELYTEYKANRQAFPEDLVPQLRRIKQFIDYLAIPQIEMPGYEADDLIGTIAKLASKNQIYTACLTNDKDYYQLVDEYIKLYKPAKDKNETFDIIDIKEVYDKFGVAPNQVIDVLALIGDKADNIPGVAGIGEVTAIPLVKEYGSLENIYDNIEKIERNSVKTKLINNRDNAFLAKELVTIVQDIPFDFDLNRFKITKPRYNDLDNLFKELGFNNFRKKWHNLAIENDIKELNNYEDDFNIQENIEKNIKNTNHNYIHINTIEKLDLMIDDLKQHKLLAVDTETSSLDRLRCNLVGISLSAEEGKAYYISVSSFEDENLENIKNDIWSEFNNNSCISNKILELINNDKNKLNSSFSLFDSIDEKKDSDKDLIKKEYQQYRGLPYKVVINKIKGLLEDISIGKCGQNLKFDSFILKRYGIDLQPIVFDSMLASYLLDPDTQHSLDVLAKKWLNYSTIKITELIGEKKSTQISMRDIPPDRIVDYACEDADIAFKLCNILNEELKNQNLLKIANEIEFPLLEILNKMEFYGIAINTDSLSAISSIISRDTKILTEKIYEEAGTEFNIDSPKQLGFVLFEKMQLPIIKKTKTSFSTDVEVLTQLAENYDIANLVLEYRQIVKLQSTYVDALPKLINPESGRIHTTYNQTGTSTGRLSSVEPNLQNIPIRSELGKEIRKAFIPQLKGTKLLAADYSQIELRIMAYYCKDKHLIEAFKNGLDIHSATASVLFDTEIEKIDGNMRRTAKTVNFGIMYGLGAYGLAQRLGISKSEASEIINNYFQKYPGIKQYIDDTIQSVSEKGYAETLFGRRRYFPNITSMNKNIKSGAERAAINMPIQGSASDLMKIAMININKKITENRLKSMMLLQVHDELVFELYIEESELMQSIVKQEMENAISLDDIPLVAELGIGDNWYQAH